MPTSRVSPRALLALLFVLLATSCNTQPTPALTPAPTITPMPAQPPVVVTRAPQRGQEQGVRSPVQITFDQPMDRHAVEAAFAVSPPVEGTFSWEGNRLSFAPSGDGFARATRYRVSLGQEAKSVSGLPLMDNYVFDFKTLGYLEVLSVQPAPGTLDAPIDALITVMFNRAVVPLTDIEGQTGLALRQPLRFSPPVQGTGAWLNTSTFVFRPSSPLLPGTVHNITVDPDQITAVSEVILPEPYEWSFTTELPQVVRVTTSDPDASIGPSPAISVTFNMVMDSASLKRLVTLELADREGAVPCLYRVDGRTVVLEPATPLLLGTEYVVRVGQGVRAAAGGLGTSSAFIWRFRTVDLPRVVSTSPGDGSVTAEPYTTIEINFGSPMNRESVVSNLVIEPRPAETDTYWWDSDTRLTVSFGSRPSSTYSFEVGAAATGRYGHRLGRATRVTFTTRALDPSAWSRLDRVGTYNAYTSTVVAVQHVNVAELSLRLYRLQRAEFLLLNGEEWWERWQDCRPAVGGLVRSWVASLPNVLNQTATTRLPLAEDGASPLSPGFYYLEMTAPSVKNAMRHLLVVTHAAVTLKTTTTEALVWVTDLQSGRPLPGIDVVLFGPQAQVLALGKADNDGVFFSPLQNTAEMNPWSQVMAFAGTMEASAFASTELAEGIWPWQFGLPYDSGIEPYRTHVYTDRAIYRPGQVVYFKVVVRADDDGRYNLPSDQRSVEVIVNDNQGRELYRTALPLNEMGTASGQLELGAEASLGDYSLTIELAGRAYGSGFQVAEYRKPEYVVSVSTDQPEYTQGDSATVTVDASYYFGGPVANAAVTWRVMSQDYYFIWSGDEYYDFADMDWQSRGKETIYGSVVTSGQGLTDSSGRFAVKVPVNIAAFRNSQIWTLEATIVDPTNQEVSSRTSVIIHKGLFYVGLRPDEYIGTAGGQTKLHVVTVDAKGTLVPGVPVTVILLAQNWYNVQVEAREGGFYWEWQLQETPVATTTVTTADDGRSLALLTPEKGGSYRVRAYARDSRENEVRTSTYIWVSSREYVPWRQENNDRIELVLDKKSYSPGDTARLLIPSPFQGVVSALLTIERGHIMDHRLLTLTSNSQQIELPLLSEFTPNVFVSVVLMKGSDSTNPIPSYRVGYANIPVSSEEKVLSIRITPDRATAYRPGDSAAFLVQVTDWAGKPVEAELSLQLVDAAVLALADSTQGSLLDSFYRTRSLGVRTGSSMSASVDRQLEETRPPTGKGGSGRTSTGEDVVRKNLLDTAYWNAHVRTDGQGQARVTVELPDNLTTWRVTAKAETALTLVGEASADIVTNKDLMVRSVAPRFFVLGDQAQLGAVIHNSTPSPLSVRVSLGCAALEIQHAEQEVQVPAHGSASVMWPVRVIAAGRAVITWLASSPGLSDGLELTLPVYHYSAPEVVATAGQVPSGEARIETVLLPSLLDSSQGELTVQLDPSLAASMREGLTYLETYPYDCIEQTISRFLPNVQTYRALKQLDITNSELEAKLPQYVALGLQRLYALQHYDGGWGWWLADESQPFLSAYALLGMHEAKAAGFAVDAGVLARASSYLKGALDSDELTIRYSANARSFVLYVLAHTGGGDLGRTVALYEQRDALSVYGKAFLLMSLRALQPDEMSRVNTLASELTSDAILSATGAHWEELETDYWTMNTDTRTTAIVLAALVRADSSNPLLPNVVRWLMTARRQAHWESTQETAWSVMALTEFMVATRELEADYDYRVALNTDLLLEGVVTAQDVGTTRRLAIAVADLLRDQANRVVLDRTLAQSSRSGEGQLYYSLSLRYFLPAEQVKALDRGIVIQRQYNLVDRPDSPISSAAVGDVIRVKLTIIAPTNLHYVVVEDPLPAGCEALDTSLKTTSGQYQAAELDRELGGMPYWWYFAHSELRDEKVALFAAYLPAGTYEYTYVMRASLAGRFLIMPATASEMYFPEVFGRSEGGVFAIQ